jgi:hypothetical protein
MKLYLKLIECKGAEQIQLVQHRVQWRAFVNTVTDVLIT